MATQNESIAKAASTMHSLYQNHYVYDECWQRKQLLKEFHLVGDDEND